MRDKINFEPDLEKAALAVLNMLTDSTEVHSVCRRIGYYEAGIPEQDELGDGSCPEDSTVYNFYYSSHAAAQTKILARVIDILVNF